VGLTKSVETHAHTATYVPGRFIPYLSWALKVLFNAAYVEFYSIRQSEIFFRSK
jgi:hypothetical protein